MERYLESNEKLLQEQHDHVANRSWQDLVAKESYIFHSTNGVRRYEEERKFPLTQDTQIVIGETMIRTSSSPLTQRKLNFEMFSKFEFHTKVIGSKLLQKVGFDG